MSHKLIEHTDGKVYISADAAAILCGTTKVTLINWRNMEHPVPYHEELKAYPLAELGHWMRTELIFKKGKGGAYPWLPDLTRAPGRATMPTVGKQPARVDKHDADIRLKTLQADKVEMELQQTAGELIPVADVTHALTNMVMRVKTRLLKIPTAIAPLVVGMTDVYGVQERLEDGVREALDELSEDWRDGQDNDDGDS
jgi:hypothetical protein